VAKWQTRTLEVRVGKPMGVRVSPSALPRFLPEALIKSVDPKGLKQDTRGSVPLVKIQVSPGRLFRFLNDPDVLIAKLSISSDILRRIIAEADPDRRGKINVRQVGGNNLSAHLIR
jgi:hypothetical protein